MGEFESKYDARLSRNEKTTVWVAGLGCFVPVCIGSYLGLTGLRKMMELQPFLDKLDESNKDNGNNSWLFEKNSGIANDPYAQGDYPSTPTPKAVLQEQIMPSQDYPVEIIENQKTVDPLIPVVGLSGLFFAVVGVVYAVSRLRYGRRVLRAVQNKEKEKSREDFKSVEGPVKHQPQLPKKVDEGVIKVDIRKGFNPFRGLEQGPRRFGKIKSISDDGVIDLGPEEE